jgi:hypothetical protein
MGPWGQACLDLFEHVFAGGEGIGRLADADAAGDAAVPARLSNCAVMR